ncbi:hypothetical protein ACLOJK_014425 [Asimina triloba]
MDEDAIMGELELGETHWGCSCSVNKGKAAKRIKSPIELPHTGARLYRGSSKWVVGHHKRTCPSLKEPSLPDVSENIKEVGTNRGKGRGRRSRIGLYFEDY